MRKGLVSVASLVAMLLAASIYSYAQETTNSVAIYDPDPQHIWNRVFSQFYVRTTDSGEVFGGDGLDPLLWYETESYFASPKYQQTVHMLGEFLDTNAETLITDPLKRAVFQHDLWAVVDWLSLRNDTNVTQRETLQQRLVEIMRRVALTDSELAALPDNYGLALAAQTFTEHYQETQPQPPFLPPDLLESDNAESAWVNIGDENGIAAIIHVQSQAFSGRSAFYVFYRVPTGRQDTLDFIAALNEATSSRKVPALPENTHVALVRQMLLIDTDGNILTSPIIESIQMRVLHLKRSQDVFQFNLQRLALFENQTGGLYAVSRNETEFPMFMSHGFDPFESDQIPFDLQRITTLNQCGSACHFEEGAGKGANSIISFSRNPFRLPSNKPPVLVSTDMKSEAEKIIEWKQTQANWQLVKKLWASQ